MKIAFIGQKGIPAKQGGVEKHAENLALKMVSLGHEVFAYSRFDYTKSREKNFRGIKIINLPTLKLKNLAAIIHALLATLSVCRHDFDIVHYHGVGPATLSFIVRLLKPQTKVAATFHCRDQFHKKWGFLARKYLAFGEYAINKFPHQTIVVSEILKEFSLKRFGRQTVYIPNGVTITKTEKKKELAKFGLEPKKYLLVVSRLVEHKGIHYLVKAFQSLKTDLKLVIVGDSSCTDQYLRNLKKLASSNKNILFLGLQTGEALAELYANAGLFVHPSDAEGLPINVLEALKYGLPSLLSDLPENIEASGGFARFFKRGDITDLTRKLEEILRNVDALKSQAELGKSFVAKKYNWNVIASKVENIYEELATPKPLTLLTRAA